MKKVLQMLVVEDHSVVRMGVKMNVEERFEAVNIREAERFPEALELINKFPFDIIILDINLPGGGSTQMINEIKKIQKDTPILIFTGIDEAKLALRYIQAGASGFISKTASDEDFITAIKEVLKNRKYISAMTQQHLLNAIAENLPISKIPMLKKLSVREKEIADLIIQGKWTNEISEILNLKANTISTVKARIFEKMEVNNPIELYKKLSEMEGTI